MPPQLTGGAAVLARLRQQRSQADQATGKKLPAVVAYASETGTCEEIARDIHTDLTNKGIKSTLCACNTLSATIQDYSPEAAAKCPVLIVVAASTGDGDPPSNSATFWIKLKGGGTQPRLKGLKYAVLGLGDSNYTRFMHVPRVIRQRLDVLGGVCIQQGCEADEVDGLEDTVDQWKEELVQAVTKVCLKGESVVASTDKVLKSSDVKHQTKDDDVIEQTDDNTPVDQLLKDLPAYLERIATKAGIPELPKLPECRIQIDVQDSTPSTDQSNGHSQSTSDTRDPAGLYSVAQPLTASIKRAKYLTACDSEKQVVHVEIEVPSSSMEYGTGDSIGVMPANPADVVDGVIDRLGLSPQASHHAHITPQPADAQTTLPAHLPAHTTITNLFTRHVDLLGIPTKSILLVLATHAQNATEKTALSWLASRAGRADYKRFLLDTGAALLDVLTLFPSAVPPLATVVDTLPALAPRQYSLASSPLVHPTSLHVAFTVVRRATAFGTKAGVASTWLENATLPLLSAENRGWGGEGGVEGLYAADTTQQDANGAGVVPVPLNIFLRKGGSFGAPTDLSVPWVMVGPGTGVTPFRGFLQHRREMLKTFTGQPAPCYLFYGCRYESTDYLYQHDLQTFQSDGTLTRLFVAFSRQKPGKKVYVQHLMAGAAEELCEALLENSGYLFVCGDGAQMVKDVHECVLSKVLGGVGELDAGEQKAWVSEAMKAGKYVREVWA